ncbi:MAG: YceI family protein [Sphingopyxis sp.]|nr:YceI family protein [Sphingopyxis sp.]
MTVRRPLGAAIIGLLLAEVPTISLNYRVDSSNSAVTAKVSFLGLGYRTADFPVITGDARITPDAMDRSRLNVQIDARQLTAGDTVTTNRLRSPDFFDVVNYPTVSFAGQGLAMTGPTTASVSGNLTARGVTRPVTLSIRFPGPPAQTATRDTINIVGTTSINRRDFGMTAYSLVVGKRVTITIRARLIPT